MKKIYYSILMLLSPILFTSCLKDELVENQTYGMINLDTKKIVGFQETTASYAFPIEDVDTIVSIPVHLSVKDAPTKDIVVELGLDNSAAMVQEYNTANDESFTDFSSSLYTLVDGLTVTIAKGTKTGYLKVRTNSSKFDPSLMYALGFYVKSVSDNYIISGNYGKLIASFGAKNAYDAVYTVDGTITDSGNAYKGSYPREASLTSKSATSVVYRDLDFGNPNYIVINNAGTSAASTGIQVLLTFDPATNLLTGISDPNTPTREFTNVSGSFDPVTRKIELKWTSGRWTVDEVWTFKEER